MDSPESKHKSDDRTSNPILKCRKNAIVIFFFCLDFCAGSHIPEAGYVMICCSSWISAQKRTPSGVAAPDGVFLFVLTALAYQAVKPLAQIIGYYLCYATATTAASEQRLPPRRGKMSPQVTKGGIQGGAVGAAACKMRVPPKARSRCREPQPVQDARRAAVPV